MPEGLPANTNPFLAIFYCDDETMKRIAPEYFFCSSDIPFANSRIKTPELSQQQAEALVRHLVDGHNTYNDKELRFAVQEQYRHIIPEDLRRRVKLTKVQYRPYGWGRDWSEWLVGTCNPEECYIPE